MATPKAHKHHKHPCGCAVKPEDVYITCPCGASYTIEVLSFPLFQCYDCWRACDTTFGGFKPLTEEKKSGSINP